MKKLIARLQGGPFDGDSGEMIVGEAPEHLWAWACEAPGCPMSGIHWTAIPEDAPIDAEVYDHDRVTPENVHVYVWKDIGAELGEVLEVGELVPA